MKKVFLGLIATVMLGNLSYGQKNDPSNPKNEFDNIGQLHNKGLDKLLENKESREMVKSDCIKASLFFLNEESVETNGFEKVLNSKEVNKKMGVFNCKEIIVSSTLLDDYLEKELISKDVNSILKSVLNELEQMEKSKDLSQFKKNMIEIEENIENLKGNDREFLLSTCSIARYSAFYWKDKMDAGLEEEVGRLRGAARADAMGAIAGGVRFGVAALFGGPVGWGAAGIAALSTGIGASAAYAILYGVL